MRRYSYLLILLFACRQLIAQGDLSQARWQNLPVVTDGANNEWRKPLNLYDAITGLLFTICNDSNAVYLCFTGNDERKITKLMKAGWMVELYSKEKNKKFNALISFPSVQMISAPGKDGGVAKTEQPDFKNEIALYRLNLQTIKASGFVQANGDLPLLNSNGLNIGVGSDSTQKIIFEMAIPFKTLYPENNVQLTDELGVHITVHALKKPAYHGDPDGKDLVGKVGSGGGRRNGRSPGASENSIFPVDRSFLFTEIDFKQKFRLAGK